MPPSTPPAPTLDAVRAAWLSGDRDAWKAYSAAVRQRPNLTLPALTRDAAPAAAPARPVRRRRFRDGGHYRQHAAA